MNDYTFHTPEPIELYVEVRSGSVDITAIDTAQTTIEVSGREPERVLVEQSGRTVRIVAERRTRLFRDDEVHVVLQMPSGSGLTARVGSVDLATHGEIGDTRIKTGSGEVRLDVQTSATSVVAGSGHVRIDTARGDVRVKSGSGLVTLGTTSGKVAVVTGSGDVVIGHTEDRTEVKTGSGSVRLADADGDVKMTAGSGDLVIETAHRGRVSSKSGSGDLTVGIPPGVPVWADIRTGSGQIRSEIESAGEPENGQEHIELRGQTGSGDITLIPA